MIHPQVVAALAGRRRPTVEQFAADPAAQLAAARSAMEAAVERECGPVFPLPVVADLDASILPTSSGRRWLRARRPDLYGSLTRPTGQEQETRRVRFGE